MLVDMRTGPLNAPYGITEIGLPTHNGRTAFSVEQRKRSRVRRPLSSRCWAAKSHYFINAGKQTMGGIGIHIKKGAKKVSPCSKAI